MNCDRELLSEYYDGDLSPRARRQLEDHLIGCPDCQVVLREYRGLTLTLRAYGGQAAPRDLPTRFAARSRERQPAPRRVPSPVGKPIAIGALGTLAAALVLAFASGLITKPANNRLETNLVVVAAYPTNGAADVVLDEPIQIEFSAPVSESNDRFEVMLDPPVPIETAIVGNRLTVRPKEPLRPDTQYQVRVEPRPATGSVGSTGKTAGSVASQLVAGSAPASGAPVTFSFVTGRTSVAAIAPTLGPLTQPQLALATPTSSSAQLASFTSPTPVASAAAALLANVPSRAADRTVSPRATPGLGVAAQQPIGAPPCAVPVAQTIARALRARPDIATRLGCPAGTERTIAGARQRFENGTAIWLADRHQILALTASGRWSTLAEQSVLATAAHSTLSWADRPDLRQLIGQPVGDQTNEPTTLQAFGHALGLTADSFGVLALTDDGSWIGSATDVVIPSGLTPVVVLASPAPRPGTVQTTTSTPSVIPAATSTTRTAIPTSTSVATPASPGPAATPTGLVPAATSTTTATAIADPAGSGPTPAASATASPPPAAPTVTVVPDVSSPTRGPAISPRPTDPLAGAFDPAACDVPVARGFVAALAEHLDVAAGLGCARSAEQLVPAAEQQFESGVVFWRGDTRLVNVLADNGVWAAYPDPWRDSDPERLGEVPPPGRFEPARGIGRVWNDNRVLRARLGWAVAADQRFSSTVQSFERGALASNAGQQTIVFRADGAWQLVASGQRDSAQP